MTMTAAEAMEEVRRRDAVEREWLGATTQGRPTFAEAELLDRQGIPSCHVWQAPEGEVPPHLSATQALRRWQAGVCAMCSASPRRLLVDHCHRTGLVRGPFFVVAATAWSRTMSGCFRSTAAGRPLRYWVCACGITINETGGRSPVPSSSDAWPITLPTLWSPSWRRGCHLRRTPMSRKTVEIAEGVYAVVEPVDEEEFEVAGAGTLIRLRVVEILAAKADIREE